jgi:hypothetical protein
MLRVITLSFVMLGIIMLSLIILSGIKLNVDMLSDIKLNVDMLSVYPSLAPSILYPLTSPSNIRQWWKYKTVNNYLNFHFTY